MNLSSLTDTDLPRATTCALSAEQVRQELRRLATAAHSQANLAQLIGVSETTLRRALAGRTRVLNPDIAEYLGMELGCLADGEYVYTRKAG